MTSCSLHTLSRGGSGIFVMLSIAGALLLRGCDVEEGAFVHLQLHFRFWCSLDQI